jgi:hypothetical protein
VDDPPAATGTRLSPAVAWQEVKASKAAFPAAHFVQFRVIETFYRRIQKAHSEILFNGALMVRAVCASLLAVCIVICIFPRQLRSAPKKENYAPKTVKEAARALKSRWLSAADRNLFLHTPRDQAVAMLYLEIGTAVRNDFKLWGGNRTLIASCGGVDPEACSSIIFGKLWESIRADADKKLIRELDCQFELAKRININYQGLGDLTMKTMLDSIQEQINAQMDHMVKSGPRPCQNSLRLQITGDPDLKCFVRAEFSHDKEPPMSLERLWGWISWRNGFDVLYTPPVITLLFNEKCAWPEHPYFPP